MLPLCRFLRLPPNPFASMHQFEWQCLLVIVALSCIPIRASAMGPIKKNNAPTAAKSSAAISTTSDATSPLILPDHIRRALFLDPDVATANARVCQAVHQLGLSRARARPQVSATISGSRQIVGRVKPNPVFPSGSLTPAECK